MLTPSNVQQKLRGNLKLTGHIISSQPKIFWVLNYEITPDTKVIAEHHTKKKKKLLQEQLKLYKEDNSVTFFLLL